MNKLSTFRPETEILPIGTGKQVLEVRGLTLADVNALYGEHGDILKEIFNLYVNSDDEPMPGTLINDHIKLAPHVIASIIAHASDEPQATGVARMLSATDQMNIMTAICRLTFKDEEHLGNVLKILLGGIRTLTRTMETINLIPEQQPTPPARHQKP